MFADAEKQMDQILAVVAKCPERFQDKCFELLLSAYLASIVERPDPAVPAGGRATEDAFAPPAAPTGQSMLSPIPDQLRARFAATAGRVAVPVERLAALFDFQLDPYSFHALNVPGSNKAERARNVGLLLCAKSYLTMSNWSADWKEFRGMCLDQDCFDKANVNAYLHKGGNFKIVSATDGLVLSPAGVLSAEALLAILANAEAQV